MRFSTYDYGTKLYTYWDDGKASPTHATAPSVLPMGGVGDTPEGAAWRLPVGARKVGSGPMPQGRIASLGDPGSQLPRLVIYAGLGFLAWKVLR